MHLFSTYYQTYNIKNIRQLTTLNGCFFYWFFHCLINRRFHLFLACVFFSLFFRSAHGAVFTATSATSTWFHNFVSATCAVFTATSATPCSMRASQRDTPSSNQPGHTKTGQKLLQILVCHSKTPPLKRNERKKTHRKRLYPQVLS